MHNLWLLEGLRHLEPIHIVQTMQGLSLNYQTIHISITAAIESIVREVMQGRRLEEELQLKKFILTL